MIVVRLRNLAACIALLGVVLGTGALAQAQNESNEDANDVIVGLDVGAASADVDVVIVGEGASGADENHKAQKFNVTVARTADPGYWIGVQLEPPSETLRSQLGIPENHGLVVVELFPETPAVAAGFAKHDLLVKIDEAEVTEVEALNEIVQETKGEKKLAVTLYRGGKQQVIEVTPAKRPTDNFLTLRWAPGATEDQLLYEYVPKGIDFNDGPVHLELFHPGVMVDRKGTINANIYISELPKELSISISKSGKQPAKISVKKGHIKWDVTEKELDKLPEDVRPHVERMLGCDVRRTDAHVRFLPRAPKGAPAGPMIVTPYRPTPPVPSTPVAPPAVAPADGNVQRQLDEVNRRLEGLQKALDSLVRERTAGDDDPQQ